MKIEWDPKATNGKNKIANYIREEFGVKSTRRFMEEVDHVAEMIMQFPNMGVIDPLFSDRKKAYRSVIVGGGLSKIVYTVEDNLVYIAAFWDCRQEPETQAAEV